MIEFELTDQPIDPDALRRRLSQSACGAVVTFEGRVRDHNRGRPVDRIVYEAYAPVAIAEGLAVAREQAAAHGLAEVLVVHRTGNVQLGELAVWIGVSSPHRAAAFAGCEGVIDTLKARVPIWKHEHYRDGGPEWLHPLP
ncbi:MAG: molybdenum cofactor biosynthesis protein MoaE [Rhodanobacteraceae bacterium]|nr:molybdenum cofactor biosynthesis protein MoaE [Rhodanobacteraceae bacterium]